MLKLHFKSRNGVRAVKPVKEGTDKQYQPHTPQSVKDACVCCSKPDCKGNCKIKADKN